MRRDLTDGGKLISPANKQSCSCKVCFVDGGSLFITFFNIYIFTEALPFTLKNIL